MIIIIEGADGVGKTTAVNMLWRVIMLEQGVEPRILHRGPPQRDPLLEYTVDLEFDELNEWTICDRWHWGELIYGPLYRNASLLSGAGHVAIDEFLARRGALLIHLDAPTDVVLERVRERGDDYVRLEDIPRIIREYRLLAERNSPLHKRTIADFDQRDAYAVMREAWTTKTLSRSV